ncbi:MAG TPA: hypothetical protein VE127_09930, partial [Solirubrobacteraceae bacterium]|nr:hypothetical protein [Solirubrobacteraceae bacterium]
MKIGKVLVRAPRDELTAADLDGGMMLSHLTIKFSNGAMWQFDVPRQARKDVRAVARELARTLE